MLEDKLTKVVTFNLVSCSRQLTLQETRKWDINDPHAQQIHTRIGEMMALDYQPFSIVSDVGFTHAGATLCITQ